MTVTKRPAARGLKFTAGNHRYTLDGQYVPGVTTILGVLDKPALPKWAAGVVAEYVYNNPDGVENLRQLGERGMVAALKVPWKKRDDAGVRGNTLHDHAANILNGDEVEVDETDVAVIEAAIAFMDDWQIQPLLIEFACASREHHWAGTGDLIAGYTHPATAHRGVAVFDWKSGKAMYPEFGWQFNAYGHAEFHGLNGDENPLPECDAAFGVQIRADGYDVAPFKYGADIYDEFLQIRHTYDIVKTGRGNWKIPGSGHMGVFIQKETAA